MIIVGLSVGPPTLLVLYILNPIILLERSITQYLCAKGYKNFLQPLKNFPHSQVSLNITTHTQPKMTRVLLTGKQPFMPLVPHPAHQNLTTTQVAAASLQRTSSIFFSRSEEKAQKIKDAHPDTPTSKLDFRIVEDIAQEDAFDEAVKIDGLEVVIHTASPVGLLS